MEDLKASYNKKLAGQKTCNFHESIIYPAIFPIKTLSQVVIPVLHIRLGTVLKLYQILLAKRQGWDKHCQNRTGTKMEENECRSFRTGSRNCNYCQCLHQFSKFSWQFERCVIWRLANIRWHFQRAGKQHQKEIKYWIREVQICCMLHNKAWCKY